jgi:hypothetical protein
VVGKSPGLLRLGKGGAMVVIAEVMGEERGRYDDDDDEFDVVRWFGDARGSARSRNYN